MTHEFTAKFNVSDKVYHKLPDSPVGMITGISYSVATNNVTYFVTFDPLAGEVQCFEWELTDTKTF
jgi:hypothetical protein